MKLSRFDVAVLFVSALASLSLLAQAPGGRGGAPPVVTAMATPEQLAQIPQIEDRTLDRTGFPAHKIIGNLYYVGTMECSSFLFVTPAGNILINSNYEETLPLLKTAIESLGFKVEDTKILARQPRSPRPSDGRRHVQGDERRHHGVHGAGRACAEGHETSERQGAPY